MTRMGNKRVRGWVAWMLPVLLWRALIPVGFMPMVGLDHSVRLVICDSYAPLPAALMDMPMDGMDMSHASHADHTSDAPIHQEHGTCPYGASPALGGLPAFAIPSSIAFGSDLLSVAAPLSAFFEVPSRAHAARAPPA